MAFGKEKARADAARRRDFIRAEVVERLSAMAALTTEADQPNVNALWSVVKDLSSAQLNLKFFGYELARSLAAALPVRGDVPRCDIPVTWKPCTQADLESDWAAHWLGQLRIPVVFHRKLWELAYILQMLWQHGMLEPGRRGLGFGCGTDPLASFFAAHGIDVTATDLAPDASAAQGWADTHQHAQSRDAAFHPHLVSREAYDRHVALEYVDMNAIPPHLRGYDFAWSVCALEHLGSIAQGLDFIVNSLETVRPGGMVVHTTEFNFTRDDRTIDHWGTVLFQRRHFEELTERLREAGHRVAPLDFDVGNKPMDRFIDLPPWEHEWPPALQASWGGEGRHLKVSIDGFPSTCFGLVAWRG